MKEYASDLRNEKKRIAFKISTAVPRVEKYNICAAVQILESISFRDDLFTRGQPPISVTGHWRILSYEQILASKLRRMFSKAAVTAAYCCR